MNKLYIIFNLSHETDDFYNNSEKIEYITDDIEIANGKMLELSHFCNSVKDNEKWTYHYVLREFDNPYDRIMHCNDKFISECKNYID